jgi:hypothetical protein
MPPTTIVDDDMLEAPAADVDGELLQAATVSAAAPMAVASWIVRIGILDKVSPLLAFLVR